ncbi:TBC1 domain family member 17-like, partial [Passer montanus]|uniref:TBC1 domain family member 17-like n=1 Tax=Passer montanus TaxID=9160 RepID=UPI001960786E
MEEAAGGRELLSLPGVSVPLSLPPRLLQGRLRVRHRAQDLVLQWEPLEENWEPPGEEEPPDPGFEPDWAVLSPAPPPPRTGTGDWGEFRG